MLFTSDRGGAPQIYKLTLGSNQLTRVTFNGSYNARPELAADGRTLVMVHRGEGGGFVIASQDLVSQRFSAVNAIGAGRITTVAPNGAMVMYTSRQGRRTVLAAVSVDARARFVLPSQSGDVREPAWVAISEVTPGKLLAFRS